MVRVNTCLLEGLADEGSDLLQVPGRHLLHLHRDTPHIYHLAREGNYLIESDIKFCYRQTCN